MRQLVENETDEDIVRIFGFGERIGGGERGPGFVAHGFGCGFSLQHGGARGGFRSGVAVVAGSEPGADFFLLRGVQRGVLFFEGVEDGGVGAAWRAAAIRRGCRKPARVGIDKTQTAARRAAGWKTASGFSAAH